MASPRGPQRQAGPPAAGRLLIPTSIDVNEVRAWRIDAPVRRRSGTTMGTGWSLSFAAPPGVLDADVVVKLEEVFALAIRQMSGWEEASDLCCFNRAAQGWIALPEEFYHVLVRALEVARATHGAFNPCLGREVDALGFGPNWRQSPPARPESWRPESWRPESWRPASWRQLRVDPETRSVWQPGGAALDLSSIAKGYAVDLCAEAFERLGLRSFLMEIGGEFRGRGVRPDGQPWRVDLELSQCPPAPGEAPRLSVAVLGLALAASGDFVRRTHGGAAISHILDGRTGLPVSSAVSGVCVIARSCIEADAWATALFALGPEEGMAMACTRNLAAIFASRSPQGARYVLTPAASEMDA